MKPDRPSFLTWLQTAIIGAIYFICVIFVFKSFTIWNQILYLENYGLSGVLGHPHALRFFLVWPVLHFSSILEIPKHELFGLLVAFNIVLTSILLARTQARLSKHAQKHWTSWFCLYFPIFAMLSIAMNGRLSFMLVGTTLIMLSCTQWLSVAGKNHSSLRAIPYSALNALGLLLLTVSSGSFSVGILALLLFTLALFVIATRQRLIHVLLSTLSLLPFITLQYTYFEKNLDFYDGSLLHMLLHGPGGFLIALEPSRSMMAIILSTAAFAWLYALISLFHILKHHTRMVLPVFLILSALVVGLFGYSALLTGLCAGLLIGMHFITLQMAGTKNHLREEQSVFRERNKKMDFYMTGGISLLVAACSWSIFPSDWKEVRLSEERYVSESSMSGNFQWLNPQCLYPDAHEAPSLAINDPEDRLHYSLNLCMPGSAQGFSWLSDPTLRWYRLPANQ